MSRRPLITDSYNVVKGKRVKKEDKVQEPARSTMSRRALITGSYKVVKGKRVKKEEQVQELGGDRGPVCNKIVVSTPEEEQALQRLREFDLDWHYGPCTGITRLERWDRADFLGLKPAKSVKDLVLQHKDDPRFVNSIWSDYPL